MASSANALIQRRGGLRVDTQPQAARYLAPIGRLLFAAIFLVSVPSHFTQATFDHAAAAGVPLANVLVPLSGVLELIGAVLLLVGYRARLGAVLLAIFLVPVTVVMHRFWGIAEPMQAQMQQINFLKNVALLGAMFLVMYFGAGPLSLDERAGR
jgi:putative oxidoreductase